MKCYRDNYNILTIEIIRVLLLTLLSYFPPLYLKISVIWLAIITPIFPLVSWIFSFHMLRSQEHNSMLTTFVNLTPCISSICFLLFLYHSATSPACSVPLPTFTFVYILSFPELLYSIFPVNKFFFCSIYDLQVDIKYKNSCPSEKLEYYTWYRLITTISPSLLLLFSLAFQFSSVQFSRSVVSDSLQSHEPQHTGHSVHHHLLEFNQTHFHWINDAIQPFHPLSSPSPPDLNLSQHQGLCKWVSSLHQVAKVLELQVQHQSFQWTPRTDLL